MKFWTCGGCCEEWAIDEIWWVIDWQDECPECTEFSSIKEVRDNG
jgi:hypothetical protein